MFCFSQVSTPCCSSCWKEVRNIIRAVGITDWGKIHSLNFTCSLVSAGQMTGKQSECCTTLSSGVGHGLSPGHWLFQSQLLRTACQTDALACIKTPAHAAGTGPIAIKHIKNNATTACLGFPIPSCCTFSPFPTSFAPPFLTQHLPWCIPLMQALMLQPQAPHCSGLPCLLSLTPSPFCPSSHIPCSPPSAACLAACHPPPASHSFPLPPHAYISVCCFWRPRLNTESKRDKGSAVWHLGRTGRQTDGTSCSSFSQGTSITFENCAHRTTLEKDVSSPAFNTGISPANGIKHALKAFEGTIFQLLFSVTDDSVVQSISPGVAVNGESQVRKTFPFIPAKETKSGMSFKDHREPKPVFAWESDLTS